MEITGKVVEIGALEQVSERFKKRQLVVEYATNPEYPQLIPVEFTQDRVALIDKCKVGNVVKVLFDLEGRKWKDRYFLTAKAWRLEVVDATTEEVTPEVAETEVPF